MYSRYLHKKQESRIPVKWQDLDQPPTAADDDVVAMDIAEKIITSR